MLRAKVCLVVAILISAGLGVAQAPTWLKESERILSLPEAEQLRIVDELKNGTSESSGELLLELMGRGSQEVSNSARLALPAYLSSLNRYRELQEQDQQSDLWKPILRFHSYHQLPDLQTQLRALHCGSRPQRIRLIQALAKKAGTDFELKMDEVYFGPWCGTYDHSHEDRLDLVARRFANDAVDALGEGEWDGRKALLEYLVWSEDDQVGFHQTLSPAAKNKLKNMLPRLMQDQNTLVRGQALLTSRAYPVEDFADLYGTLSRNPYADTRAKAIVAMQRGGRQFLSWIRMGLDDPVDEVKEKAIEALGSLRMDDGDRLLIKLLQVPAFRLRSVVIDQLEEHKVRSALPVLAHIANSPDDPNRTDALCAIAGIDVGQARPLLRELLRGSDADEARAAIYIVSRHDIRSFVPVLRTLVGSSDKYLRESAVYALERLGESIPPAHKS